MCGQNAETSVVKLMVHIAGTTRLFRITSQIPAIKFLKFDPDL